MQTKINSRWFFSLIIAMLIPGFGGLKAQGKKVENPKIDIKVNKEKDDKGNITRYDSSYSYSWHGEGLTPEQIDSVFNEMKMGGNFNDFFKNDFWGSEFFDDDFFKGVDLAFSGFDLDDFMNMGFPGHNSSDSLKPGFYERFFQNPMMNDAYLDKLREMMKNHEPMIREHMQHFKNLQDSTITGKPEIGLQNDLVPPKKSKGIKT